MQLSHRILAVDDSPTNLAIIEEALQGRFSLRTADDGEQALQMAPSFQPDVVLLDVMMPGTNGYEVCSRMKNDRDLGLTQVIMVSAKTDLHSRLRAYQAGADDYIVKPFSEDELFAKVCVRLRAKSIYRVVRSELEALCGAAGEALELVSQLRDSETAGHLVRMRDYAQMLALELQKTSWGHAINDQFLQDLYRASPLHDIGKVAVPDAVLHKLGQLSNDERAEIQQHTIVGERILQRLAEQQPDNSMFRMAVDIARSHHECYDGSGYPDGLVGADIPLAARITSVADVFDALTSARCYKTKQVPEDAREVIVAGRGTVFDPAVVDALLRVFDEMADLALNADRADENDA